MSDRATGLDDRLLAEAVRLIEADGSEPVDHQPAADAARAAGGDLEERVIVRAKHLPEAARLQESLRHVRRAMGLAVLAAITSGLAAGALAARAGLGAGGGSRVNIFWMLITLLGVQTLLLLVWVIMMLIRPRALRGGSLGAFVAAIGQRAALAFRRGPIEAAAAGAVASVMLRGAVGRWTLGSISHAVWLAFNIGAASVLVTMLSTRSYVFVWETTILSSRVYVPLTQAIAAGPHAAGFIVPTEEQIRASQWPVPPPGPGGDAPPAGSDLVAAGEAWSGLVLGSLILYGFGPRAILLGLCLSLRRAAVKRYRLNLERPGFSRLAERLMPESRVIGVVDGEDWGTPSASPRHPAAPPACSATGPPAILGYEITPPRSPWPPPLHAARWLDLGFVEDRAGRHRALAALAGADERPVAVVVVAALTATPDRGAQRFLEEIAAAARAPLALVLTAGAALRERGGATAIETRLDDWRTVARAVGIDAGRVLDLDLDHLTDTSARRLEAVIGPAPPASSPVVAGHMSAAFDLIAQHANRWPAAPGAGDMAELHRQIARLYRGQMEGWGRLVDAAAVIRAVSSARPAPAELAAGLRRGADRIIGLLPDRLRLRPRWLAAGALAGALGCVAAATLLSPVAIGALPVWSGIGAAIAALVQPLRKAAGAAEAPAATPDLDEAVRAAALFASLLELQGRDESTITRVLDATFAAESLENPPSSCPLPPEGGERKIAGPGAVRGWLDEVRHRFDLAVAAVEHRP